MAKPTVYKWTDPGAPVLKQNQGIAGVEAVFRACLIDGYGSKTIPVAGANPWTMPVSSADNSGKGFVLKQGGTNPRKLCLKIFNMHVNQGYAQCEVAEDYTDIDTPVGGIISVPERTTTTDARRVVVGDGGSSYELPWVIFATERTIICQFGYNDKEAGEVPIRFCSNQWDDRMANGHWMFGDYINYGDHTTNQVLVHPYYTSSTFLEMCKAFTEQHSGTDTNSGAIQLFGTKYGKPGRVIGSFIWLHNSASSTIGSTTSTTDEHVARYPNPVDGKIHLDRYRMTGDFSLFGELPGLLYSFTGQPYQYHGYLHEIDGPGGYEGSKLYCFGSSLQKSGYFVHDGEWGVE